jgi:putative ABC transport system permease protein
MNDVARMEIWQFSLIYLLLLVVLAIMKMSRVHQAKLMVVASVRMTVQLALAGFVLTYLFQNPHPAFTFTYLAAMTGFAVYRVLQKNRTLNRRFQMIIAGSVALSGLFVLVFFIYVVVGQSIVSPRYVIPIAGMLMGNTMTGTTLGIKAFRENLTGQRARIEVMLNIGATPQRVLLPFARQALETALLPTFNAMVGMGIVSLPGMMTGQILSGTLPTTAIMYQIAIMIAICTVVCLSTFGALFVGYRTLFNARNQITLVGVGSGHAEQ